MLKIKLTSIGKVVVTWLGFATALAPCLVSETTLEYPSLVVVALVFNLLLSVIFAVIQTVALYAVNDEYYKQGYNLFYENLNKLSGWQLYTTTALPILMDRIYGRSIVLAMFEIDEEK